MGDEQFLHTFLPCRVSAANMYEILMTGVSIIKRSQSKMFHRARTIVDLPSLT